MIRLKNGTSLDNVHPRMFLVIGFAAPIWRKYHVDDLWVTAGNEAGHTTNPDPAKQYHRLPDGTCQAVDLRTKSIAELEHRRQAVKELTDILGPDYFVQHENPGEDNDHCHVQLNAK